MKSKQLTLNKNVNQYLEMHEEYKEKTPVVQEISENTIFEIGKTSGGFNWVGTKNGYIAVNKVQSSFHYTVSRKFLGINLKKLGIPHVISHSNLGYSCRNLFSSLIRKWAPK